MQMLPAFLIFTALLALALWRLRYKTVYTAALIMTAALPLIYTFLTLNETMHEGIRGSMSVFLAFFLLPLAPATLLLSMYNIARRKDVALYVSIIGILIALGLILIGIMLFGIAGAGMVG